MARFIVPAVVTSPHSAPQRSEEHGVQVLFEYVPSTRTGTTSNCRLERARTDGSRRECQDSIGDCAEVIEPGRC
ncbi:hypothetical protein VTO73DRAFT_13924 [Trametes versicolor]